MENINFESISLTDLHLLKTILSEKLETARNLMFEQRGKNSAEFYRLEKLYKEHTSHQKLKKVNDRIDQFVDSI